MCLPVIHTYSYMVEVMVNNKQIFVLAMNKEKNIF